MSIFSRENPSTIRKRLLKQVITAFRNIVTQEELTTDVKDSAVYIYFLIKEIKSNVESTASAWEKRDYWIKSDKFRREWEWLDPVENSLENILESDDWSSFSESIMKLSKGLEKLKINVSQKDLKNRRWHNAFSNYHKNSAP